MADPATNPIFSDPVAMAALLQKNGLAPPAAPAPPAFSVNPNYANSNRTFIPAGPPPPEIPGQASAKLPVPQAPQQAQPKPILQMPTKSASPAALEPPAMGLPQPSTLQLPQLPQHVIPEAPRGTIPGDRSELSRLQSTGSGISQIAHKIEGTNFGQDHPLLGKIAGIGAQGLATLGDIGVSALSPRIASLIPGTENHHMALERQAGKQLTADEANAEKEAQVKGLQSEIPLHEAQTQEATAKATAALNPVDKTAFAAWEKQNPSSPVSDFLKLQNESKTDKFTFQQTDHGMMRIDNTTGEATPVTYQGQPLTPRDKGVVTDLKMGGKEHSVLVDPNTGAVIKDLGEKGEKPVQPPGVNLIIPNAEGGQTLQRVTPGQTVGPGAMTAAGMSSQNVPTTQMRNTAQRAQLVHSMVPEVIADIDKNAAALGPVMGRWNEFMQGKVGADNPSIAQLRADLLLMSSSVALAHAQGRLPENLRAEFDHLINAPKQSPENLKAVINEVDRWMVQNQSIMKGNGSPSQQGGGGGKAKKGDPLGIL